MDNKTRSTLLLIAFCVGCLSWDAANAATESNSNTVVTVERLNGVFTVTAFQVVNGATEAFGLLTAHATASDGFSVDIVSNTPIRLPMPIDSPLAQKAGMLTAMSTEPLIPPQLGTNTCKILGISIAFIDVTIPGLGLNVHVNELSLVVRADADTVLGDILCTLLGEGAYANLDATQIRNAAQSAGLNSLASVPIPEPSNLDQILNSGAVARTAAVQLGKALFWDMQVGSDGVTCATCHHHAGADSRLRNQLSPGLQRVDIDLRTIFNDTAAPGVSGGPNYALTELDFPLHRLTVRDDPNFETRAVTFDTDDVVSSMGVFAWNFTGIGQPLLDAGTPYIDTIFNSGALEISNNVRRVEGRNAPTVINAVFTHANFWDGRAHNIFNGVSALGPLDTNAAIWINIGPAGSAPTQQQLRIANASLASQAVSPITGDFEMSFHGRPLRSLGVKLLSSGLSPLGQQLVHPSDSVLGPLSRFPAKGLATYYTNLVQQAFQPKYWNGGTIAIEGQSFTQMEANFSLFFGLAIQLYEGTLVSNQTPFDRFMAGDYNALSSDQLRGLLAFINQGLLKNPPAVNSAIALAGIPIGEGNCVSCHAGPEFTAAALTHLRKGTQLGLTALTDIPSLLNGLLQVSSVQGAGDVGFANIGVRPANEDLARGRLENGFPLSFVRQALNPALNFLLPPDMQRESAYPTNVQVDGAFKIPGLRNVELTGPYFHNGGQATLAQVIEFYHRHGDFGDVNLPFLDRHVPLISIEGYDEEQLIKFLLALTDERVRLEQAPFDHPQLLLPNGGTLGNELPYVELPAVGATGRTGAGLPPLGTFLNLSPLAR
jgi:cytochrome c peroxidase